MNYTELKDKDIKELNELVKEKKKSLFVLRHKLRTMQLTNTSEISATKKEIAQILTAINAKKGA
ncbi:50S ribosomal protein L29 [Campylobacter corcagiensis]|uniref:Large ribosomal subunit protein uL29 n=1 Tax=Campylobacter corcagiensis TaxID=1448857 RepID=A0A7M1LHP7_9BACT|nr:50S ribosomal protein L29 [Campylobacter corcagiensis]QKF65463.1 50S ribosomal protein L29 [Campylobacter corcagiensis]QOQ87960.1 50S ribosomal protein L29 [Campylobacter corcagiensis]